MLNPPKSLQIIAIFSQKHVLGCITTTDPISHTLFHPPQAHAPFFFFLASIHPRASSTILLPSSEWRRGGGYTTRSPCDLRACRRQVQPIQGPCRSEVYTIESAERIVVVEFALGKGNYIPDTMTSFCGKRQRVDWWQYIYLRTYATLVGSGRELVITRFLKIESFYGGDLSIFSRGDVLGCCPSCAISWSILEISWYINTAFRLSPFLVGHCIKTVASENDTGA